jgi:hypothetical protein
MSDEKPMDVRGFVTLTAALDAALALVAVGLAFALASWEALLGVAVGGGLGWINLLALGFLCRKAMTTQGARWPYLAGMAGKFALLIAVVSVAVRFVPMDVIGFVVGLSMSGLAILGTAAYMAVRRVELSV